MSRDHNVTRTVEVELKKQVPPCAEFHLAYTTSTRIEEDKGVGPLLKSQDRRRESFMSLKGDSGTNRATTHDVQSVAICKYLSG